MMYNKLFVRLLPIFFVITLSCFLLYGIYITFFPVLPFWIDEWCILDNIKFRPSKELWGDLERLQQFPRVYLQLINAWSGLFTYSYWSLRVIPFLVHCAGIFLLIQLSRRIFPHERILRYLWVLLYVSYSTSIHYFAQVKQYTMEMSLSVIGIWQLIELLGLKRKNVKDARYWLLCLSFLVCPFFSYTYALVAAPIYLLWLLRVLKDRRLDSGWLPRLTGLIAGLVFYLLELRFVLQDRGMNDFWKEMLMTEFSFNKLGRGVFSLFANLGSGDLFSILFGLVGISAFLYQSYNLARGPLFPSLKHSVFAYGCLLSWLVIVMFAIGKLPLGVHRLNAFAVASIALLVVSFLRVWNSTKYFKKIAGLYIALLYIAAIGNVFVTGGETIFSSEHVKKLRIYRASSEAVAHSRTTGGIIFITPMIAYPFNDRWTGEWILKTLPAYTPTDSIKVYPINSVDSAREFLSRNHLAGTILDGENVIYFE